MPGITGIIRKHLRATTDDRRMDAMLKCMLHDGSYASGKHFQARLGVCSGWTAHPGSFSDCMPVWNEARDIVLLFTGEHFGDPGDCARLRAKGHQCTGEDASQLVHLYEEFGMGFLQKLNGWFSGLLLDMRQRKSFLFNDRYGLGRLYYHEAADSFYFSSEAKSLLSVLPSTRQLDAPSLAEFCSCGCVLQNRTLFSGISLLPGGSLWTFSPGEPIQKELYFQRETWECQPILNEREYYLKLKETFRAILPRYFREGEQIGMSLTGGLDGRLILAWADCQPGTLPCYTFGGSYRDCADVQLARKLAKACQQPHQTISVEGAFLGQFPALAEKTVYLSDGAMDVSGAVELYVNRLAKQIAPIRLTGNYGSEILRGNIAFKPRPLSTALYDPEFIRLGEAAAENYASQKRGRTASFIAFKQVPWHHYARLSVEQSQITLRAPYLDNDLVALIYQAPDLALKGTDVALRLIVEGNAALGQIPTDRGLIHRPVPVLTRARQLYQELTVRAEYAYDYGMPQWLARIDQHLKPLRLERLYLGRHKFYHYRVWYRDQLAAYVKEMLIGSTAQSRFYLRGNSLETLLCNHFSGAQNYTLQIHQALTCELIQRQLIETN
ncbi:MAG: asparagine synthase-related protein [Verrucomicrobia bacterium]|nr:asparagine synthase-related protein [Verrucomicrobiota bacterium]